MSNNNSTPTPSRPVQDTFNTLAKSIEDQGGGRKFTLWWLTRTPAARRMFFTLVALAAGGQLTGVNKAIYDAIYLLLSSPPGTFK